MADKSILKQYVSLKKEIEGEERRIAQLQKEIEAMVPETVEVADVVTLGRKGKRALGLCRVHGFEDHRELNRKKAALRERKARKELHVAELEKLVIEAEEYIYTLGESDLRTILLYSCIDGLSWREVAKAMGEGYTEEACKQAYSRFMRAK